MKLRRTKIVATMGPASSSAEMLEKLIKAGVNVFRVNYSHGEASDHATRIQLVRDIAKKLKQSVGILADLQGPKIRISRFKNTKIKLNVGDEFILDAALDADSGDETVVGIDYKALIHDVSPGDTLLLDDGRIVLKVKKISGSKIINEVLVGGVLSNNKGINRQGGGLSAKALTEKDQADLKAAVKAWADYIAVSFPRDKNDIFEARQLIKAAGGDQGIIAKIERAEAITNIDEIIKASDGVMVARGDLAIEIGDVEVPGMQKLIIQRANELDRSVIVATQMMESMIEANIPTRAEVSDVANAVLDLTDAVMLSAESAVGKHPALVVETMAQICVAAERNPHNSRIRERQFHRVDEAIAAAAIFTANRIGIKAIIALTESGSTPLMMSRMRTGIPIYGLSRHALTLGKMTLFRDVYPIAFDCTQCSREAVNSSAVACVEKLGLVEKGDLVLLTKGDQIGVMGGTNALKFVRVGEVN